MNLRFPGQHYDAETGLHYNYYRYYDPETGRYITSDPIGLLGGLNTYAYSYSNPIMYFDMLGLDATENSPNPSRPSANLPNAADAICGLVSVVDSINGQQHRCNNETHENNSSQNDAACDGAVNDCENSSSWPNCLDDVLSGCRARREAEDNRYSAARDRINRNFPTNSDASSLCNIISP